MMSTREKLNSAIELAKEYDARKLLLFGSALDNFDDASDIDLACEGVKGWKFFELASELENLFQVKIDLISLDNKTSFTKHILKYGKIIYDKERVN